MGFSLNIAPFFASFPTAQMRMFADTVDERTVSVIDGKLRRNPSGGMSGIVNDFGFTPGKSKTVKMSAVDGAAPEVGTVVVIGSDRWRVLSVASDQAGIAHSIDLGDEFTS